MNDPSSFYLSINFNNNLISYIIKKCRSGLHEEVRGARAGRGGNGATTDAADATGRSEPRAGCGHPRDEGYGRRTTNCDRKLIFFNK